MNKPVLCPYCGNDCSDSADYVDIGVGEQQCTPFSCECGACQIGSHDQAEPTADEQKVGWYAPGRAYLTSGPKFMGRSVGIDDAKILYRKGLLNQKPKHSEARP